MGEERRENTLPSVSCRVRCRAKGTIGAHRLTTSIQRSALTIVPLSAAGAVAAAPVKVFTPIIALFTAGSVVPAPLLLPLWVALVVAAWLLLRLVAPVVTVAIDPVSLVPHRRPSLGKPISVAAVGRCASVPAPVPAPVPAAVVPSSPGRRTRASSTAASATGPFGAVPTRWTIEPRWREGRKVRSGRESRLLGLIGGGRVGDARTSCSAVISTWSDADPAVADPSHSWRRRARRSCASRLSQ
jgi:hypothetical protein